MITADMLVLHLVGDYVIQSDWMATEKTKRSWPAFLHALTYTLPFLLLTRSPWALALILGTHFVIDRWRLARYVCWAKNWFQPKHDVPIKTCLDCGFQTLDQTTPTCPTCGPTNPNWEYSGRWLRNAPWKFCSGTGYPSNRPAWLAVWLMILADNTMHLILNGLALHFFG